MCSSPAGHPVTLLRDSFQLTQAFQACKRPCRNVVAGEQRKHCYSFEPWQEGRQSVQSQVHTMPESRGEEDVWGGASQVLLLQPSATAPLSCPAWFGPPRAEQTCHFFQLSSSKLYLVIVTQTKTRYLVFLYKVKSEENILLLPLVTISLVTCSRLFTHC